MKAIVIEVEKSTPRLLSLVGATALPGVIWIRDYVDSQNRRISRRHGEKTQRSRARGPWPAKTQCGVGTCGMRGLQVGAACFDLAMT